MTPPASITRLIAQSVVVGLALAFIAVLVRPELVLRRNLGADEPRSYAAAVAASAPAVVSIFARLRSETAVTSLAVPMRGGLGSGVIISETGYLVTNWHVIDEAEQVIVQLADGRTAMPRLIGADPETELALLKLDLPNLPYVELGHSDTLRVGDVVLAIGNSLGLSQTVTMGIVSATGRGQLNVTTFENFIQTDAAINIGSSGGALVDSDGRLIGINTAIVGSSGWQRAAPEGIGFAIPINLVRGVLEQLMDHGRVIRGYLGVEPVDLSRRESELLGLDQSAVLLERVFGPAAAAGLYAGDVLTHVNQERVTNRQQLMRLVASAQPGSKMTLAILRGDSRPVEIEAELTERPAQTDTANNPDR